MMRIPRSTYRLQMNKSFTFKMVMAELSYFEKLGISDIYLSPIMKAVPGSLHGYDVTDYNTINPEIGSEEEFKKLVIDARSKGFGIILDIVPNHMCIDHPSNVWWFDVLENGPSAASAIFFDIDWNPPKKELQNKVLLPILDAQYGEVIERKGIQVVYQQEAFWVAYGDKLLPVNPNSWSLILSNAIENLNETNPVFHELLKLVKAFENLPMINELDKREDRIRDKEIFKKKLASLIQSEPTIMQAINHSLERLNGTLQDPHSFNQLELLLSKQAYRLSYWRVANDEINYRRFFDINQLAGIRAEEMEVFDTIHQKVLQYVENDWITGLRIDHIDGLLDPDQYLETLQSRSETEKNKQFYLIVEKILTGDEKLRKRWPISGTTGYDVLNLINAIFIESENKQAFIRLYDQFKQTQQSASELIFQCKQFILMHSMSSELYVLARKLDRISEQHRFSRDFTLESLRSALRDVIASFPIYRSYIQANTGLIEDEDKLSISRSIQQAKRINMGKDQSVFDFIHQVLILEYPPGLNDEQIEQRKNFVMRFQQMTGPVMAKGLEDTAFYRYFPLVSINEVGGEPGTFGIPIEDFHSLNQARAISWPHTLITLSTHDTKRSEDVRARINVLSELPKEWKSYVHFWKKCNRSKKTRLDDSLVPDQNDEYLFYQILIGVWPFIWNSETGATLLNQMSVFMQKAIKEAKRHSGWINPNSAYEQATDVFVKEVLSQEITSPFFESFLKFVPKIQRAGVWNSLSQLILKMTLPGIPDLYQGNEIWKFSLVDPDNRKIVDFSHRSRLLEQLEQELSEDRNKLIRQIMDNLEDGKIKLFVTREILHHRNNFHTLYSQGDYKPITVEGIQSNHLIGFSRNFENNCIIVAVPRFFTRLPDLPIGKETWQDTSIVCEGDYEDLFTCKKISSVNNRISCCQLFSDFPFSILVRQQ